MNATVWHDVAARADLADPGSRAFTLAGERAGFIVCRGGVLRAFRNRCPHTGVELNWGGHRFLDPAGEYVQCTMHGALFRPDDGRCVHGPCVNRHLEALPVRERAGRIEVQWPDG